MRERRVLLSQAAVRAISSYKEFAKGALHATDEDAEEAAKALQATVQQTFRDLQDEVPAAHLAGDHRRQGLVSFGSQQPRPSGRSAQPRCGLWHTCRSSHVES